MSNFNRDTNTVTFNNGSQLIFMTESFDTDKELNRFRGLEVNGAGADELNELHEATFKKLIERSGTWLAAGDVSPVILATCNPTHNWVKTTFYDRWKADELPERWEYIQARITDNPYIPESYLQSLKANMMPLEYARFVEGDWQVIEVNNRFARYWHEESHVKSCAFNSKQQLIISMDFNIEPFGFIFAHAYQDSEGHHVHIFDESTIEDGNINKACEDIRTKYGQHLWNCIITGDYNGNKRDIGQIDHASNFEQIRRELKLQPRQMQMRANPRHKNSRNDLGFVLYHSSNENAHKTLDFRIEPTCEDTLRDMRFVEADGTGSIVKSNRKEGHQRADHMDAVRYLVHHKSVQNFIVWRQKQRF